MRPHAFAEYPHIESDRRVLIYSLDVFGLWHLRRCYAIAQALVQRFTCAHVLIISGSPSVGTFEFKEHIDFVKVPSFTRHHDGECGSICQHTDIGETLKWRKDIILATATSFEPDVVIVADAPLGLCGELLPTLEMLKARGCRLVVGLPDVSSDLDAPLRLIRKMRRTAFLRQELGYPAAAD